MVRLLLQFQLIFIQSSQLVRWNYGKTRLIQWSFFLNGGKLPLNSVGQFKDPVRYLCLVGCVVLTILICAHNLYLKMKRTKYLAKPLTQKVQV